MIWFVGIMIDVIRMLIGDGNAMMDIAGMMIDVGELTTLGRAVANAAVGTR